MPDEETPLTLLLQGAANDGSDDTAVLQRVYRELRNIAGAQMGREAAGHTLQATALVHEAWMRLGAEQAAAGFEDRRHFFGAASRAMRQILIERHRRSQQVKRGGEFDRVDALDPDAVHIEADTDGLDLLALDGALTELEQQDPRMAEIVQLRFFSGLTTDETADALDISRATVKRDWIYARAWLFERMSGDEEG